MNKISATTWTSVKRAHGCRPRSPCQSATPQIASPSPRLKDKSPTCSALWKTSGPARRGKTEIWP